MAAWTLTVAVAMAQTTSPTTGLKNYGQALFGDRPARSLTPPSTGVIRQAAATSSDTSPTVTADYGVEAGSEGGGVVPVGGTAAGTNPFAAFEQGFPPATPSVTPSVTPSFTPPAEPVTAPATTATPPAGPVVPVAATASPSAESMVAPAVALPPKPALEPAPQPAVAVPASVQPKSVGFEPALPKPTAVIAPTAPVPTAALLGLTTGGKGGPKIEASWERDGDIHVGEACTLRLVVKNFGDAAADAVVDATIPSTLQLADTGAATATETGFTWAAGELGPGMVKSLTLQAVPSARGEIDLTAVVTTRTSSKETFAVAEPLVEVVLEGPDRVMIGDPAPYTIVVRNPGTGTADDITIEATIPVGLEHSKGQRLAMGIGSLTPGESRVVRLPLTAIDGGEHAVSVIATAGERLRSEATSSVFIITPSLKLALDGPGLRYIGRTATYTLKVTNDGSAPNSNVRVTQQIPDGFAFVRADGSGRFDSVTRQAKWFLGRLDAGETRELHLELSAERLGSFVHQAATVSEHGARSDATLTTLVDGTPSLTMQIVDLDDPVEVGAETAYEIRIENEGTKAATNVAASCKLPLGATLVEAGGASPYRSEGSVVFFRPLETLRPGQSASYRVRVRGDQAGNQRFRVRLSSDSITEPLIFEELTKFYKD
ncbi:MAG: hypothetical protein AAF532_14270 [Planctomycetota bacterium]